MKHLQTVVTAISAVALVAAFAAPTLAAKSVIADEDMDQVTAAGQPKIAQAEAEGGNTEEPNDATAVNFQVSVFAAHMDGQRNLTALTLNNIFGENQVANGVNVQSGSGGAGTGPGTGGNRGSQSNGVTQSWGSAKAAHSRTTEGTPGTPGTPCTAVGLIAKCNGGKGGDAKQGKIALLWEFADEIAHAEAEDTGDATAVNIVVTINAVAFGEDSQTNLTALTVNNVYGFNQVANGTNVSSGAIGGPGGRNIRAGGSVATSQSNDALQLRGAPNNWWQAKTFF